MTRSCMILDKVLLGLSQDISGFLTRSGGIMERYLNMITFININMLFVHTVHNRTITLFQTGKHLKMIT